MLTISISFMTTNLKVDAYAGQENSNTIVTTSISENAIVNEQEETKWDGITTTDIFEGKGYKVTYTLTGHWKGGFNASVKIENTGKEVIENWVLEIFDCGSISNVWNATISGQEESNYIIKNAGWNQDIAIGKSVEFGMSGNKDFSGFPQQYELQGMLSDVVTEAYAVNYQLSNDWGSGFTSQVSITNQSEETLEDWVLEFDYDRTITTIWNATIISHEGNHYVIKNAGHNSNILPLQSVSFGFNGKDGKKTDEPKNYNLYSYSKSSEKELVLAVNTQELVYNETGDFYVVQDSLETLAGTMSETTGVKKLDYEIEDINGNIVKSGEIPIQYNWTIESFGLAIGYNKLSITATLESNKKVTEIVKFMNYEIANMDRTTVDISDTDNDGLDNYCESILGTNKIESDTDGDELSDYDEFIKVGTDPTKQDSDENSVLDGSEDYDQDQLNNLLEIKYGTNCLLMDTDGDGFLDGEEVSNYQTNPVIADTDEDGLSDKEDVKLAFNPINPDTDGDGILDGKEVLVQTCNQSIDTTRKAGITNISVKLGCDGFIDNRVEIMDTYNLDMRSTDVVGLIGVPVEISTEVDFNEADITFSYDETALGETVEDDLCMMWYDEKNDTYVLLEDCILDKDANTITYSTTHFSTYLVVDKRQWVNNLQSNAKAYNTYISQYGKNKISSDTGTIYKCFETSMTWGEAKKYCESIGGHLVTITSEKEQAVIDSLLKDEGVKNNYWIGAERDSNNIFSTWITGEKITYSKYKDGRPDNYLGVENALMIYRNNNPMINGVCYGYWNDINKNATCNGESFFGTKNMGFVCEWNDVNLSDSDKDGLYDICETAGVYLSNGRIVYSDPNKIDTDGDGVNDFAAVGGNPSVGTYKINGKNYSSAISHSSTYAKLSPEFIYVDGTLNSDGKRYYGEMDYLPYTQTYMDEKYKDATTVDLFGEKRGVTGIAGVHNSFADKYDKLSEKELYEYYLSNTTVVIGIETATKNDLKAMDCFLSYVNGTGGDDAGWREGGTRKIIDVSDWLIFGVTYCKYLTSDPMQAKCIENVKKTRVVVENILNDKNTEAYLSISPNYGMDGGMYFDDVNPNALHFYYSLYNIAAFGTFNKADAGITVHCTYDPTTKQYKMEYNYYLIDFYNYDFLDILNEQDALGMARSYELYGVYSDCLYWKKGKK